MQPAALRRRASPNDRSSDRWVALVAIVASVAFLVAAIVATVLPDSERRGAWLPLHLALAGAATTAIAGVMPFFTAAFAAAPPSDVRLRSTAVSAVALGATSVALGFAGNAAGLAVIGGCAYVGGIMLTVAATRTPAPPGVGPESWPGDSRVCRRPLRGRCGGEHRNAVRGRLATDRQQLGHRQAGPRLVERRRLRLARDRDHDAALLPDGHRRTYRPACERAVDRRGSGRWAPVVALGFVITSDLVTRVGAIAVISGAIGLAVYVGRAWSTRARWTTDQNWHRFAIGGLVSAIVWLELGLAVAAGRLLAFGAEPAGWKVETIAGPLIVGWVGLAIIASATHLLPAIGPGDQATHARQRQRLGRWAVMRLVLLNTGVLAFAFGLPLGSAALVSLGAALIAIGLGISASLLATAARMGIRQAST